MWKHVTETKPCSDVEMSREHVHRVSSRDIHPLDGAWWHGASDGRLRVQAAVRFDLPLKTRPFGGRDGRSMVTVLTHTHTHTHIKHHGTCLAEPG